MFCGPLVGLPLEPDATPIAMAVTAPMPRSTQVVVFIVCACLTPAGLPGASGAVSAAKAAEASNVEDKAIARKLRMFPPFLPLFLPAYLLLELYTKAQLVQRTDVS